MFLRLLTERACGAERGSCADDGAVRAGSTDDYRPGAIGTKYACGIFFAFAKCASMVKQRTEGSSFDAHVGAEQIFTIVVMVETSGGCFGKTNAALVAWRCPGIFMDVTIFHQRAEQWRQQLLAVAGHRGNGASGDKVVMPNGEGESI